jgi:hypothetical protein
MGLGVGVCSRTAGKSSVPLVTAMLFGGSMEKEGWPHEMMGKDAAQTAPLRETTSSYSFHQLRHRQNRTPEHPGRRRKKAKSPSVNTWVLDGTREASTGGYPRRCAGGRERRRRSLESRKQGSEQGTKHLNQKKRARELNMRSK